MRRSASHRARFRPKWGRRRSPAGARSGLGGKAGVLRTAALAVAAAVILCLVFSLGRQSARFVAQPGLLEGSRFVTIGGQTVRYVHEGPSQPAQEARARPGRRMPLLLIHGFGASAFTWRMNIPEWASEFDVWALDLPGYGLSAKPGRQGRERDVTVTEQGGAAATAGGAPPDRYAAGPQAAVVAEFMQRVGLERAVVVGSSMGGAVALELALSRPDLVGGLVLVDCSVGLGDGGPSDGGAGRRQSRRQTVGLRMLGLLLRVPGLDWFLAESVLTSRAIVRGLLTSAYADPATATSEVVDGYVTPLLTNDAPGAFVELAKSWLVGQPPGPSRPLSQVKAPTLVIWGQEDRWVPLEVGRRVAEGIRGARLEVVPGCGHLPHEESPAAVNRLVAEFARGLRANGGE